MSPEGILFEIGKQAGEPAHKGLGAFAVEIRDSRGKGEMNIVMVVQGKGNLTQLIGAFGTRGRHADALNGREGEADQ